MELVLCTVHLHTHSDFHQGNYIVVYRYVSAVIGINLLVRHNWCCHYPYRRNYDPSLGRLRELLLDAYALYLLYKAVLEASICTARYR